jgi:hypothetical protein
VADNHEAAIEAAVGELLERDAFVRWWYQLDASRPLWASSSRWRALVAWFSGLGWELTVHRLPGPTRLPVLLAAAIRRDESNATVGSVIGLAAAHIGQSIADVMCTAAAEIVQAVEGFSICAAVGRAPVGDLAAFLTPQRASTVAKLLAVGVDEDGTDSSGAVSAVDAADEAGLSVWLADLAPPGSSLSCVQAYSPDTMPFPATNRGRRLDHPALRGRLTELGRELESVPMLPHPLG